MTDAESRRAINEAINAVKRFVNSRQLDALHAARSGVALNLVAIGILHRVIDHGPVRPTELAELADIQPAALSRQIRILEDGGYIVRVGDAEDGRVSMVEATEQGRAAYRSFSAANDALLAEQLRGWTAEELGSLAAQMQRLVADLRGVRA
ncbi:MAG: MarR family transcriptional regulator [Streptomycetaceae bacterium]|jgi:DNA-binding MarR family transcriptional regulator|uniref:HTH marR-type domain-containing protein n=1 Tax=Yinghuangia aomiensis TaxID=676205 RepID=A0ABP9IF74_9ACTN|nr:MarR family transcriptional regulator [Streptomycetaceae bacterium]